MSKAKTVTPPADKNDEQGAFLAHVDEGLADAKAGRFVAYDKVRRWLLSWGTEDELPPPACR